MSNRNFWDRIKVLYRNVNKPSKGRQPSGPRNRSPSTYRTQPRSQPQRQPVVSPQRVVPPPVAPPVGGQDISAKVDIIHQAASQFLMVEMVYDGQSRLVEGYSFRERAGGRLFFGFCSIHARIHSFRLEKIESLKISDQRYSPRWPIEL